MINRESLMKALEKTHELMMLRYKSAVMNAETAEREANEHRERARAYKDSAELLQDTISKQEMNEAILKKENEQ